MKAVNLPSRLTNVQYPGANVQVRTLGEETVQLEHQDDDPTAWLLPHHHHHLVGVDLETGETVEDSGDSQLTVLDDPAALRTEDSQVDLIRGEDRVGENDLSGRTKYRQSPANSSEISNSGQLSFTQFPQGIISSQIVGVREYPQGTRAWKSSLAGCDDFLLS